MINYNGYSDTCELIESLKDIETYPYEVVVVDNNSRDNQGNKLKEKYPQHTVVCSKENLGFSRGNNLGIEHSKGEYLFILNNDTLISRPMLKNMVSILENHPEVGCVCPKITFYPNTKLIQYAGATAMTRITLRNDFIGYCSCDSGQYETSGITNYAHGAAMMVRRKDLSIYGSLPDMYFLYYEELDWCEQMKRSGFSIWYEPSSVIHHKESASVGVGSPLRTYYQTRNRFIFAHRTMESCTERLLSYLYQALIAFPKRFVMFLCKGKLSHIKALTCGVIAGIKQVCILKRT